MGQIANVQRREEADRPVRAFKEKLHHQLGDRVDEALHRHLVVSLQVDMDLVFQVPHVSGVKLIEEQGGFPRVDGQGLSVRTRLGCRGRSLSQPLESILEPQAPGLHGFLFEHCGVRL